MPSMPQDAGMQRARPHTGNMMGLQRPQKVGERAALSSQPCTLQGCAGHTPEMELWLRSRTDRLVMPAQLSGRVPASVPGAADMFR